VPLGRSGGLRAEAERAAALHDLHPRHAIDRRRVVHLGLTVGSERHRHAILQHEDRAAAIRVETAYPNVGPQSQHFLFLHVDARDELQDLIGGQRLQRRELRLVDQRRRPRNPNQVALARSHDGQARDGLGDRLQAHHDRRGPLSHAHRRLPRPIAEALDPQRVRPRHDAGEAKRAIDITQYRLPAGEQHELGSGDGVAGLELRDTAGQWDDLGGDRCCGQEPCQG
jgi:hypothetical protein